MSQPAVEIERGHRTNERAFGEGTKGATAYSSSMLDDEPMGLDALSALDQAATNYIEYSKAMKATTPAPPQDVDLHVAGFHSSDLLQSSPTDQRECVAQQYLAVAAAPESESLQLVGRGQNEVGRGANATNQSNRLGQNNNVELTGEYVAEAGFDMSGEKMRCTTMADSDLPMIRWLKRGMEENAKAEKPEKPRRIGAAIEADGKRAAKKLKQHMSQENRRKKENQKDLSEQKREQKVFEKRGLGNLPQAQTHRRMSRTDSKIAALGRAKRSVSQRGYLPNQSFSTATPSDIPGPADGGYPAPSHPQDQQPLPNIPANSMAQPNTQLQPAPQLQPKPMPSSPSPSLLVAICHDCSVRITEFPGSPYDLPTSCPNCRRPLIYQPVKKKSYPRTKTTSRFRHLPLDQRPAARAALKSNVEINSRLSTGSALTPKCEEPKQFDGQGRKRRWTAAEKKSPKVARSGLRGENGKESAAVHVDSEATEGEDEVVFIKEVSHA